MENVAKQTLAAVMTFHAERSDTEKSVVFM